MYMLAWNREQSALKSGTLQVTTTPPITSFLGSMLVHDSIVTQSCFDIAYLVHFRSPPFQILRCSGIEDGEEDDNAGNRNRAIERRAQDKIIPLPPRRVLPLHKKSKKQPDNCPAAVVGPRRRRNVV